MSTNTNWTIATNEDDDESLILSYLDDEQTVHHYLVEDVDEVENIKISKSGNTCSLYDGNVVKFYIFNTTMYEIEELGTFDVDLNDNFSTRISYSYLDNVAGSNYNANEGSIGLIYKF